MRDNSGNVKDPRRRVKLAEQDTPGPADGIREPPDPVVIATESFPLYGRETLPSHLLEPELTAYKTTHARIAAARAALLAAEETWAILAPILASRYHLAQGDRITADGTICRGDES